MKSEGIAVVPSTGGRSAYATDVVDVGGLPIAITAILTNADDIWLVNVAQLAETPPMRKVRGGLKEDAIVPNAMVATARVDPAAQAAVDRFKAGLAAQQAWGDDLASRSDAVVVGPTSGDVTRGKSDIKKLWKKRVKANVREAIAGDVGAAVTPDGQLAWVTAPVVRFADDEDPLPLRAFAIFEKNGAAWRMVVLHEALAIDAAGAGATFKKTPAPAIAKPAAAPPAKPAKPASDDAPPKKKKKKKKPPPPSDDQ